ncbi:MAG: glycerophosphodiester phosphodiesterase [Ghiorsea sp.]|nr:glycerophosphodiester phosphodiesterase [Ghiorsea sp.]
MKQRNDVLYLQNFDLVSQSSPDPDYFVEGRLFFVYFAVMMLMSGTPAMALDLDSLEDEVLLETCHGVGCGKNCDDALKFRLGKDLPLDADYCHSEEQYNLLEKNLYRTGTGEIKVLNKAESSNVKVTTINMLAIKNEAVNDKSSPYVIDLQAKIDPEKKPRAYKPVERTMKPKPRSSAPIKKKTAEPLLGCKSFKTFGHRGGHGGPENSIPAVLSGLEAKHNGVEIDTQLLTDGTWVVHHDPMIGRSSYGVLGFVNTLTKKDWNKVYLLSRSGKKTKVKAPLLEELLQAFKSKSVSGQVLNIEIKMVKDNQYKAAQLASLNKLVLSYLKPSQFIYTSTFLSALKSMRTINTRVYLGLVIEPNPVTMKRVISTTYGAEYRSIKGKLATKLQSSKRSSNRAWLNRKNYAELEAFIGPSFGLHLDYRDMDTVGEKLREHNVLWMVYELDDDAGLLQAIQKKKAKHLPLPPAIIIDSPRAMFCSNS